MGAKSGDRTGSDGVLVHEWLTTAGGSENVFSVMASMYPRTDIVSVWNDDPARFDPSRTRETWIARSPLRGHKALSLPLMPSMWRRLPYGPYEWALISTHAFAHHARFPLSPETQRFVYVHSPARYVWVPEVDARGANPLSTVAAKLLRPIDRRRAQEAGATFAANSDYVRQRVLATWGVDARVIYPPVDVEGIAAGDCGRPGLVDEDQMVVDGLPDRFLLGASRFIPYKRLDLVIRAGEVLNLPVVLAGGGPRERELRARAADARVPVSFVVAPSTPLLHALFRRCSAYVFPAVEDFGIMPVEALAAGAPVIAQSVGGTAEIVEHGVSGGLTDFSSRERIQGAYEAAVSTRAGDRRERAFLFSTSAFERRVREWTGR